MIHNIIRLLLFGIGIDCTFETMSNLLVPAKDSQITPNVERMSGLILAFFANNLVEAQDYRVSCVT